MSIYYCYSAWYEIYNHKTYWYNRWFYD